MFSLPREQKLSSIRRLAFAAKHLPEELPRFWEHVATFANESVSSESAKIPKITSKEAQLCVENLMELDSEVFANDETLFRELCQWSTKANNPFGCVLISKNRTCKVCREKLLLKARDSVRKIVVYDDERGTYIGCHYIKYCRSQTCKFRQYYGKHTTDGVEQYYDEDWMDNKFFLSTQQTAFTLRFLKNFDIELLIGQISYNQKANIYNAVHHYNRSLTKNRRTSGKGEEDTEPKIFSEETYFRQDNRLVTNASCLDQYRLISDEQSARKPPVTCYLCCCKSAYKQQIKLQYSKVREILNIQSALQQQS